MADNVPHIHRLNMEHWDIPVDLATETAMDGEPVTTLIFAKLRSMPVAGNTLVALFHLSPPPERITPSVGWVLVKAQSGDGILIQLYYSPNLQPSASYTWIMQSAPGIVPIPRIKMMECAGTWIPESAADV